MQTHQSSRHKRRVANLKTQGRATAATAAMQCGAQGPKQSASDPLYDVECTSHLGAAIAPFQEGQPGGAKRRFEQKTATQMRHKHIRQDTHAPPHPTQSPPTSPNTGTHAPKRSESTQHAQLLLSRDLFLKRHNCARVFAGAPASKE